MLLGSGDHSLAEAYASGESLEKIHGYLRSFLRGRDYETRAFEEVILRVVKTGELTARHRMTADKYNALFIEHRCAFPDHIFLDTAGIYDDTAFFKEGGILLYEVYYRLGVKTDYGKICFVKSVRSYLLVNSSVIKCLIYRFLIVVQTHYMMECMLLESFAERTAYQAKTDYRDIHFIVLLSKLITL